MAMIAVNYEEFKPETYESVHLLYKKESKVFSSGNFVKDWFELKEFIENENIEEPVFYSSSVGDFIDDGAKFRPAHLINGQLEYGGEMDGSEYFVKKGTKPTWQELKELVTPLTENQYDFLQELISMIRENDEDLNVLMEKQLEKVDFKMRNSMRKFAEEYFVPYREYYNDGQLKIEGTIVRGNAEGLLKTYYENGQLCSVGKFKSNKRNGLWKEYNEDGSLIFEINYSTKKDYFKQYYPDGTIAAEGEGNKKLEKDGLWRFYEKNGKLQVEENYKTGKSEGVWKCYYKSGALKREGMFENDLREGSHKSYYSDGKLQIQAFYKNGRAVGEWITFYKNGNPKIIGSFKNDERIGLWKRYKKYKLKSKEYFV